MGTSKRYPEEVRERAVRMVAEQQAEHGSQWAAINSIASKIGCTSESLRRWVRQAERDHGERGNRFGEVVQPQPRDRREHQQPDDDERRPVPASHRRGCRQ